MKKRSPAGKSRFTPLATWVAARLPANQCRFTPSSASRGARARIAGALRFDAEIDARAGSEDATFMCSSLLTLVQ
jgi:hypothetical protein